MKQKNSFPKDYWDNHYNIYLTPWDMGMVSPPIKAYIEQLKDKSIHILIPGAGNSYEAEYLWNHRFRNTNVLDISKEPLKNFKSRVKDFPQKQLIHDDFFNLDKKYDLILEQTFFCSLHPQQRVRYCHKAYELLKKGGKLAGLLFTFPLDPKQQRPPFGGSVKEYRKIFQERFTIQKMESTYNSHPARQGNEVFIILQKMK